MIRVISIDDHKLFSEGLSAIIGKEKDMVMVNCYDNGLDVLEIITHDKPDVVLLDISLPIKSGISIAQEIKEKSQHVKIIMLSMLMENVIAEKLKNSHIEAYISKEIDSKELVEVIRKVHGGEKHYAENNLLNDGVTQMLTENFKLTAREIEIVKLLQQGKTTQEIADLLHRSLFTITTHRKNINQKLRVKNSRHSIQKFLHIDINPRLDDD